jgi:hypothetical protein
MGKADRAECRSEFMPTYSFGASFVHYFFLAVPRSARKSQAAVIVDKPDRIRFGSSPRQYFWVGASRPAASIWGPLSPPLNGLI